MSQRLLLSQQEPQLVLLLAVCMESVELFFWGTGVHAIVQASLESTMEHRIPQLMAILLLRRLISSTHQYKSSIQEGQQRARGS